MKRKRGIDKCKINDCDRLVWARDYCSPHYQRYQEGKRGKALNTPVQSYGTKVCKIEGCTNKHESKSYCKAHYTRYLKGTDLNAPLRIFGRQLHCDAPGCDKEHSERGYCESHAVRLRCVLRKRELVAQFGGVCHDCKGIFPPYVFDFDNVGTAGGHTSISRLLRSNPKRIQQEIKRCEMVCANCHRIRTNSRYFPLFGAVEGDEAS